MGDRSLVLGVDAGGTSLRVRIADARTGEAVGAAEGMAAPDGGPGTLSPLISAALRQANIGPEAIGAVCAGITKISRGGVPESWGASLATLFPLLFPGQCRIVADYVIAFHGAIPGGIGVAVVAGTGSVIYGEDGQGGAVRVGGRGWEFGDEGSGAWLTTEAVRRTLRALDGLENSTPLTEAVCQLLGTREPAALGEAARAHAASEGRGFLVPFLLDKARAGDPEAVNLFVGAGGWLAAYVRAVANRLQLPQTATIATIGGLWEAGDLLRDPFQTVVHRWLPDARIVAPDAAPVVGATRLAAALTPL